MMSQPALDLSDLFGAALQAVTAHRQEINDLDGYNGNHGDNMVENVRMIVDALKERGTQTPSEALGYAGERLRSEGQGGTSQYYAKGLSEAVGSLSFGLRGRGLAAMMPVYLKAVVEVESAERQAEQHIARLGWDRMDEEPEDDKASTHLHDGRHCVGTRGEYPAAVEHRPKAR